MHIVNIHEAQTHLLRLIEHVQTGEEIIIEQAGKPVARLVRYDESEEPRQPGIWRGRVQMDDDFDELPEDFLSSFEAKS